MDSSFKYNELLTLVGLLEVQVETYSIMVDRSEDAAVKKFLQGELSKMKALRTKINKTIKEY